VRSREPVTVAHFSDSAAFGGTERALLQLLGGLDRARWRPVLFHADAPGASQLAGEARALEVPTYAVASGMPQASLIQSERRGSRNLHVARGILSMSPIARTLRGERARVFHAHQTWSLSCRYGIVAAALARVPVRIATAQLFVEMPPLAGIDLQHALLTRCLDRHVAVSRFVASRLRERFGVPDEKIVVIPNAAVTDATATPAPRSELARADAGPIVLTVARLDGQKGIAHLLDAVARIPNASFAIAGDGPNRAALETRAATLGVSDRVRFLGHRRDVPALLAASDLFVLPSLYEGLPLSVLEAMASGVPVIATSIGGTDEVVRDGETGTLVPAADSDALADAIARTLGDREHASRLALAARSLVAREYSVAAMVRSVSRLYDELLAR
jgi:glycosyltransferase involved in cell wall biosynthesis